MEKDLETVFEQFEAAWVRGEIPDLTTYLPALDSPKRQEALQELIRIDMEFRWRNRQTASIKNDCQPWSLQDYRNAFPELTVKAMVVSRLIAEEYRVRKRWGVCPDILEFADELNIDPEVILPQLREVEAELIDEETVSSRFDKDDEDTVLASSTGDEFEIATSPDSAATDSGTAQPERFGDYDLLSEIARGGMGVVYKARQRKLNRIVALKMIKSGELAGEEEIQRFHTEAEAAARLDHPGIVPIYEVGEENGLYFFSMGFIDGEGLDVQLKDGPLPSSDAAALIALIAEAVQFAHDKGIVHRDLKPANVLLDADAKPRIADFGLAKNISGDSGMTATGQVMGTPSYMPPEQAAGRVEEIGPLSDVYSLGALLYATLTGRPPFQSANAMETLKQVLDREPVAPRALNPAVDRDLETICLKCLEKEASNRYATADDLAEDLRRYGQGLPISARPMGRLAKAFRWCRRNKSVTAVIIMAAILTVASPIVAAVQFDLREQAEKNLALFKQERDRANRNLDHADAVVKKFVSEVGREQGVLSLYPATQPIRKKLLGMARDYYETLIADNPNSSLSPRLAAANLNLAFLLDNLAGDNEEAIEAYHRAQEIYVRLAKEQPAESMYQSYLADCFDGIADLHNDLGQTNEAMRYHQRALTIRRRLAEQHPTRTRYQSDLAASHNNIGLIQSETGKTVAARVSLAETLKIFAQLAREDPTDPERQNRLAIIQLNMGHFSSRIGKPAEALRSYQQAERIFERLMSEHPTVLQYQDGLAGCRINIGGCYDDDNRPQEALKAYRLAQQVYYLLAEENPVVTSYQNGLAGCFHNIGIVLRKTGELDSSLVAYQQSLKLLDRLVQRNPAVVEHQNDQARSYNSIGLLHSDMGKPDEAIRAYLQAVKLSERVTRENPENAEFQGLLAGTHQNIGRHHREVGKPRQAMESFQKSLNIRKRLAAEHPQVIVFQKELATSYYDMGLLNREIGQLTASKASLQQALQIRARLANENPASNELRSALAETHFSFGVLFRKMSRNSPEALAQYQIALRIRERLVKENPKIARHQNDLAATLNNIGLIYKSIGRREEAVVTYRQALRVKDRLVNENRNSTTYQVSLAGTCVNLANILRRNEPQEALSLLDKAVKVLGEVIEREPRQPTARRFLRNAHSSRARTLDDCNRHQEAIREWRKAMEFDTGERRDYYARKLSLSLARNGQHKQAASLANQLLSGRADADDFYELCRSFAIASGSASRDASYGSAERRQLAQGYARTAQSILDELSRVGFFAVVQNRERLRVDPDLDALRHRVDFRAFAKSIGVDFPVKARKPMSSITPIRKRPVVAPRPHMP